MTPVWEPIVTMGYWAPRRALNRGIWALLGTPFIAPPEAQITLTAVWDTNVTMGYWAHLGYPIWGLPPGPGVWDMGEFIMHRWNMGY